MKALFAALAMAALLSGCGSATTGREDCGAQVDAAWKDLDLARAQGFAGTVSYGKALALLTRAKANQTVEDYKDCNEVAKRARFYIAESRRGR